MKRMLVIVFMGALLGACSFSATTVDRQVAQPPAVVTVPDYAPVYAYSY